jgi:membrane protein
MADDFLSKLDGWSLRHPLRVGRVRLTVLVVRIVQSFLDVRVMGLAAEMTYYAILSVFPLIGALGASLGFLERIAGRAAAEEMEAAVLRSLHAVFSPEITRDVMAPLVQGLLREERAGFAIGSFLVTLFLASRVFRSAIHTLDVAYSVEERRGTVPLWTLGFVFSLLAIVTITAMLSLVVVGPLLGGGHQLAGRLGLGAEFALVWDLARWPVVFGVAIGFLVVLYRYGPNVRNRWRQSLPGAVFGVAAMMLVAVGFRTYLQFTGDPTPSPDQAEAVVALAAQIIGAILAALLWLWLSGMVILTGGVVNAEVSRELRETPPPQV